MKKLLLALLVITTLFSACNNSEGTEAENNESSTNPETESATPQRTGDLAQIDSLGRVLNEDPNNQKAFLMRANLLMKRGETRRAANDIYNAMQLDSSAAEARLLKGIEEATLKSKCCSLGRRCHPHGPARKERSRKF